jgi:Zn-dependent alcohol dehydrogenase
VLNTITITLDYNLLVDNINMDSTITGSMNDNINMDSTITGSMNDNINMDSTITGDIKLSH